MGVWSTVIVDEVRLQLIGVGVFMILAGGVVAAD